MPKTNAEDKEKLKEKLQYIGLNLERVPKFLKETKPLSFRASKSYDETTYKVYRYLDVTEIQILLTPTDRLANLSEKYKLSAPIASYLDSKSEENIERFTTLLAMLNNTEVSDIQALEEEQEVLKKQIPYEVKYANNFIWQIYYSDVSNQYFMLVPTNEYSASGLFYLLKKQIEAQKNRKKELIYVPVSHQEYSGNYLVKSQITDLENYLWYFTKEWPAIYEVYDSKGKMSLKITGKAKVYEKIQSSYVITLNNKEEALEQYKLIKALFILATGLPEDYQFKTNINEIGELEFSLRTNEESTSDLLNTEEELSLSNNQELAINYENLLDFIQKQVKQKRILIELEEKKITKEQKKQKDLKEKVEKQTGEYLAKQRQIATFLECKKTFFGKVKYYFSNRKKEFQDANKAKNRPQEKPVEIKQEIPVLEQDKEIYTIEDLIEICTKLDARRKMMKNLQKDSKALELKVINLESKIKNANIYLNEIELHKKSIFEFWKFTNKDEIPSLNEGEETLEGSKEKIEKSFDYEVDIEELGKQVDELQRRKLSKNEADSIFAVKQALTSSQILNETNSKELDELQEKLIEKELKRLKQDYKKDIDIVKAKEFDIFGSMSEDKTKIKVLKNQKHREIEKDRYNILNITPQTDLSLYIDNLRNYLKLVKESFCKITTSFTLPIYMVTTFEIELEGLQLFHLDQNKAIQERKEQKEMYLYKINWLEGMPILYYSNIIFYDNFNKTLPIGMDLSDEVLVDLNNCVITEKERQSFRINYMANEFENKIVKVNVIEYDIKKK